MTTYIIVAQAQRKNRGGSAFHSMLSGQAVLLACDERSSAAISLDAEAIVENPVVRLHFERANVDGRADLARESRTALVGRKQRRRRGRPGIERARSGEQGLRLRRATVVAGEVQFWVAVEGIRRVGRTWTLGKAILSSA